MRRSAQLLAQGFWKRSVEELKRKSNFVLNLEGVKGPTGPLSFIRFSEPESLPLCKKMCDRDIGGFSTVNLDFVPASSHEPAHARFHGSISTELPKDNPEVQRSGFAGWRTWDQPPTLFGRPLFDVETFKYLALRVKSDGRSYYVNVQTESIVPTDLHQHLLYARKPGTWETILIDWDDFVRTNHGFVVEPQKELLKQKVRTVGMSLTDGVPGPYDLCISRVWATNGLDKEDRDEGHWKSNLGETAKRLASEAAQSDKDSAVLKK